MSVSSISKRASAKKKVCFETAPQRCSIRRVAKFRVRAMPEADRDAAAGSSSDPWQGFRPLSSTPLPPEVEEFQLKKLAEARALSDELWSNDREAWNNAASRANSSKLSISVSAPGPHVPCTCDCECIFYETWSVILTFRIRALPASPLACLALLHDADLIVLPKWPGLPYIEGVRTPKYFAANDLILRPMVQPWAVFPGADSIHNALLFTDTRDNSALVFVQSPPAGSTSYRGWDIPPPGRRRKRNVLLGMTERIRPAADAPNAVDGEVCMRGVLPVPSWLIPHWLLRWVAPIFFSKIIPLFIRLGQRFETPSAATASDTAQQFVRRVTADADGFYASAAKAGLVPEEQLQAFTKAAASNAEETGLIDAGIAQPSPRGPSSALREARRMRVAVEIIG